MTTWQAYNQATTAAASTDADYCSELSSEAKPSHFA